MSPQLESGEDLPEECHEYDCTERPQTIVEVEIADGEPERFALCILCACEIVRRDAGRDKVRVVGP